MSAETVSAAPARKLSRNPLWAFYQSSIGKKITVAVTGFLLIVYVLGHLLGNLQIYLSAERLNVYAQFLQAMGPLLWLIRIGQSSGDRKSTRLNSSHSGESRMPSSA